MAKAEAEGAFTLYSTDPEQGQVKLLASFNKLFPNIKTSYVRLQLTPEGAARPAAGRPRQLNVDAEAAHDVQPIAKAEDDAFHHGTRQVGPGVMRS